MTTLANYLKKNGISVIEFAKELECSRGIIYQYLNGTKMPSPKTMIKIEKLTNGDVQPNDFFRSSFIYR